MELKHFFVAGAFTRSFVRHVSLNITHTIPMYVNVRKSFSLKSSIESVKRFLTVLIINNLYKREEVVKISCDKIASGIAPVMEMHG